MMTVKTSVAYSPVITKARGSALPSRCGLKGRSS